MIFVSEGEVPKPPGESELVFDFSDGQSWWIGHSVSCPVCNCEVVLQKEDGLSTCGLKTYSFFNASAGRHRGRGVLNCPTCKLPVHFDKQLDPIS